MKHFRFIVALSLFTTNSFAQKVKNKCEAIYEAAASYFENNEYQLAIKKIAAYKICNIGENKKADSLLLKIYETVNNQRIEALRQRNLADSNAAIAVKRRKEAEIETKKAQSLTLAAIAREQLDKNPTFAIRLAELAWKSSPDQPPSLPIQRIAAEAFYGPYQKQQFYFFRNKFEHSRNVIRTLYFAQYSPDGKRVITAEDTCFRIWDAFSGRLVISIKDALSYGTKRAFSPSGNTIVTILENGNAKIWDVASGKRIDSLNNISEVTFSPDGKKIALSNFNAIKILDAASGKLISNIKSDTSLLSAPAFSPDGKKICVIQIGGNVKVWDVVSSDPIVKIEAHADFTSKIVFSPDGKKIVINSSIETAKIWDAFSGKLIADLIGHTGSIYGAAFSSDGKQIITNSKDSTVKTWDAASGKMITDLTSRKGAISIALFSPDGKKIITICNNSLDSVAKIWDAASGKLITALTGSGYIDHASFSPDGLEVLTVSQDTTVKIWDVSSAKLRMNLKGYFGIFSPVGKNIVTLTDNNITRVWDKYFEPPIGDLINNAGSAHDIAFSSHEKNILISYNSDTTKIWDSESREQVGDLNHLSVNDIALSSDGKKIITTSGNNIKVWDVDSYKFLTDLTRLANLKKLYAIAPDAEKILGITEDNHCKILEVGSGKVIADLTNNINSDLSDGIYQVSTAAFSPNGKDIFIGSYKRAAEIRDASSGRYIAKISRLPDFFLDAVFSPDGKKIFVALEDNTARILDALSGKTIATPNINVQVTKASFSPDSRKIITVLVDHTAKIWDAGSGKLLAELVGHGNSVVSGVFSPDGKKVVTGSYDKTAKIWDVASGKIIIDLQKHSAYVNAAAFSPDGKKVATASDKAKIWLTPEGIMDWLTTAPIYKLTQKDLEALGIDFIDLKKIQ